MYCLCGHFVGKLIYLAVTNMNKIAVSVQCDTQNAFSTHSCRATTGINVKVVIQNAGKDPEQNLVGCFDEFKTNSGILHCFKKEKYTTSIMTHLTWNGPKCVTCVILSFIHCF